MNAPDPLDAEVRRAMALHQQGKLAEADAIYRAVLQQRPDHFGAVHFSGLIHLQSGRYAEAARSIGRAVEINPSVPEAHSNLAFALQSLGRFRDALASSDRALALRPDDPDALNNRGNALYSLGHLDAAVACFDRAVQLRPAFPLAFTNRGNVLRAQGKLKEALQSHRRALDLWPDFPLALDNCGRVLRQLGRHAEAAQLFLRLLSVSPNHPYAPGLLFDTRLHCCEWTGYDQAVAALTAGIERGERLDVPQSFASYSLSPEAQLKCVRNYVAAEVSAPSPPLARRPRAAGQRLHIAYLSADLRDHAMGTLLAGLFEAHDRSRFEVTGVSFGPDDGSAMRRRLVPAFERFLDVRDRSDSEVASLLRDFGVDISVDLAGFTAHHRVGILGHRAAPIQVNWLGYPCTMGAPFIDYIVADRHIVPPGAEAGYAEKVVRLPDSYQSNDDKRPIAEHVPSRAQLGLPPTGFVFCCFNATFKIRPIVFDVWMRLLQAVPGSVLWLLDDNAAGTAGLRRQAELRGVAADRLVFAGRAPAAEHLARQAQADLFLDTFPYNAHTTASDALWAGLPVVTMAGSTFASRVATSLVHAAGLPELATDSLADYEALALRLATTPELLTGLRRRLGRRNAALPLFDTVRFARHLEQAFLMMDEIARRGAPPRAFDVPLSAPAP